MRERGGVEGPMKLLVDRDADGDGVGAGDLHSDVGRWCVPARTWYCCASGAGTCEYGRREGIRGLTSRRRRRAALVPANCTRIGGCVAPLAHAWYCCASGALRGNGAREGLLALRARPG